MSLPALTRSADLWPIGLHAKQAWAHSFSRVLSLANLPEFSPQADEEDQSEPHYGTPKSKVSRAVSQVTRDREMRAMPMQRNIIIVIHNHACIYVVS